MMSRKRRSGKPSIAQSRRTSDREWWLDVQETDGKSDHITIRPLGRDWVYETRLTRSGKEWVVSGLRVFPYSPELERDALNQRVLYAIRFGETKQAARAAVRLAHLARNELIDSALRLPAGGLQARHIRQIRLTEDLASLRKLAHVAGRIAGNLRNMTGTEGRLSELNRRWLARVGRLQQLAKVAACYAGAVKARSRSPNAVVERECGLSPQKARDAVFAARKEGFLTPAPKQGALGGGLTDRARVFLGDPKAMSALEPDVRKLLRETMSETE